MYCILVMPIKFGTPILRNRERSVITKQRAGNCTMTGQGTNEPEIDYTVTLYNRIIYYFVFFIKYI